MTYTLDGEPKIDNRACPDCGQSHESVTGFVLRDRSAHAVFFVDWYPHTEEAYIEVILGSWEGPDYPDQVTFGCRIGRVAQQAAPAASLVEGGSLRAAHPMFGRKLDRAAALEHPWLAEFWSVVDWLVMNEQTLHDNVFHMPPAE